MLRDAAVAGGAAGAQVSIEFDVADAAAVGPAAGELEQAGYELLHAPREEPWGETVARLQSPEGAIVGISERACAARRGLTGGTRRLQFSFRIGH